MGNKTLKVIFMILLIVLLFTIILLDKNGHGLTLTKNDYIKKTRHEKKINTKLEINNVMAIYDEKENVYYYNIPNKYENKKYSISINLDKGNKYKINNQITDTIIVKYDEDINLLIYNQKYYYQTKIRITNLPIINISTENKSDINNSDEISTQFTYINNLFMDSEVNYSTKIHVRGDTSRYFPKKSYRINFYDEDFDNSKNVNFSNFYNHDTLVLQSLYSDPSKMRNKIETDIWNNVSKDFKNNDLYSEYVEVFINNEYMGLYVLSESVNRKKLNLNKTSDNDTSVVLKVVDYTGIKSIKEEDYKLSSYNSIDLKYPNDSDMYSTVWKNTIPKLYNYYSIIPSTYDSITSTFVLNNYIDLILFNDFTMNVDNNVKKNNYFYKNSLTDELFYIEPWDMELSFGLKYDSDSSIRSSKTPEKYNQSKMINYSSTRVSNLIKNRYIELEKNIFNEQYINKLINKYYDEIKYAAIRDSNKWYKYNLEDEVKYIKDFVHKRIEYYREYINNL